MTMLAIGAAKAQDTPAPKTPTNATANAPTLSEVDGLKLDNALLRIENLQREIGIEKLQALERMNQELQAIGKALEKSGYLLQRAADGKWSYVPKPAEEKPTPADEKKPGGQ